MGPLGILGWSALFVGVIFVLYKNVFLMGEKPAKPASSS
jgi:hypothetical protein